MGAGKKNQISKLSGHENYKEKLPPKTLSMVLSSLSLFSFFLFISTSLALTHLSISILCYKCHQCGTVFSFLLLLCLGCLLLDALIGLTFVYHEWERVINVPETRTTVCFIVSDSCLDMFHNCPRKELFPSIIRGSTGREQGPPN